MKEYRAIGSFDFDKTVADSNFPDIVGLHDNAREVCGRLHDVHDVWIGLWSCRDEHNQTDAENFLKSQGFRYNSFNAQHPKLPEIFGYDARKLGADFYVEDKDIYAQFNPNFPDWLEIERMVIELINGPNFFSLLSHRL
jgi:hypothetical protein